MSNLVFHQLMNKVRRKWYFYNLLNYMTVHKESRTRSKLPYMKKTSNHKIKLKGESYNKQKARMILILIQECYKNKNNGHKSFGTLETLIPSLVLKGSKTFSTVFHQNGR